MHAHNRDSPVMAHKLPNPGARGFVANQDPLRADVSILTQLLTAVLLLRHQNPKIVLRDFSYSCDNCGF